MVVVISIILNINILVFTAELHGSDGVFSLLSPYSELA